MYFLVFIILDVFLACLIKPAQHNQEDYNEFCSKNASTDLSKSYKKESDNISKNTSRYQVK